MMKAFLMPALLMLVLIFSGCTSGTDTADNGKLDSSDTSGGAQGDSSKLQNTLPKDATEPEPDSSADKNFVGKWRIYSERIYYDTGGSNYLNTPVTRQLELKSNGKWAFGSSTGTWEVKDITAADWEKWGVDDYGPTRKIVLNNWNNVGADGPIEETENNVDFIWAIYRSEPPTVSSPAQIQIKFGHATLN